MSVTPAFAVIGDLWAGCTCCRRFVEGGEGKESVGEDGEEGRRWGGGEGGQRSFVLPYVSSRSCLRIDTTVFVWGCS